MPKVIERVDERVAEAGSEYVRWVQTMLNQALGLQLPVDGVMLPSLHFGESWCLHDSWTAWSARSESCTLPELTAPSQGLPENQSDSESGRRSAQCRERRLPGGT